MMKKNAQALEPPEGIGKLSTELLIQIFTYLSPQDRLTCSLVSKRWLSLARAWEFHGALQVRKPSDKETIPALFKGRIFPFKKLVFTRNVNSVWRKEWKGFWRTIKPHIHEIEFGVCKNPALNFQVIELVLPTLPGLQKLTVLQHNIELPNPSTDAIVLQSLRELDLSKTAVSKAVLTYFVDCCPVLEVLEVSQVTFGEYLDETIETLRKLYWVPAIKFRRFNTYLYKQQIAELNSFSNLEVSELMVNNAGVFNYLGLFAAFQNHLDYIEIEADSFRLFEQPLLQFLTSMKSVKAIKLTNGKIDMNFAFNLFSQIKGLKTLELEEVGFHSGGTIAKYTLAELEHLSIKHMLNFDQTRLYNLRLVCPNLRSLLVPRLEFGFIDAFPLLEHLEITSKTWINLSAFYILKSLQRLTHLRIFNLQSIESSDWEFFHFKALQSFKILTGKCSIRVDDLHGLAERNPTIREIYIATSGNEELNEESLKNSFGSNWSVSQINRYNYSFFTLNRGM